MVLCDPQSKHQGLIKYFYGSTHTSSYLLVREGKLGLQRLDLKIKMTMIINEGFSFLGLFVLN